MKFKFPKVNFSKPAGLIKNFLKRFSWLYLFFNPEPLIGGLTISDTVIRYTSVIGKKIIQESVAVPTGIVTDGNIIDMKVLADLLASVRKKIHTREHKPNVVLSICPSLVFSQIAILPQVSLKKLSDTIDLNVKMISPFDLASAYYDYEVFDEKNGDQQISKLLASFVSKDIVNSYVNLLEKAGFYVVALEFTHLSLVRFVQYALPNLIPTKPYLIVDINPDGIDIIIFKNSQFYFGSFSSWQKLQLTEQSTDEALKPTLMRLIKSGVNYYFSTWKEAVSDIIFFDRHILDLAQTKEQGHELTLKDFTEELSFAITPLAFAEFGNLESRWFSAIGAALRSRTFREKDRAINLKGNHIVTEYLQNHFLNSARTIFDIIVTFLLVSAIFLFGVLNFIMLYNQKLEKIILLGGFTQATSEFTKLRNDIETFNESIVRIQKLQSTLKDPGIVTKNITDIARNHDVIITHLTIDQVGRGIMNGGANQGSKIIDFKNELAKQTFIEQIDLPLAHIISQGDSSIFDLTFQIKQ